MGGLDDVSVFYVIGRTRSGLVSTLECLGGFALAVGTAILMTVVSRRSSCLVFGIAQGVSVGFSAFLIGLMASTVGGNVYVTVVFAAGFLSLIARDAWRGCY